MNVAYRLYQTKKQSNLMVRMYRKNLDVSVKLDLHVTLENWNQDDQCFLNAPEVNAFLLKLKLAILERYNQDLVQGIVFDKKWLQSVVSDCFSRPSGEQNLQNQDRNIYLTDFAKHWLDNDSKTWKTSYKETMSKTLELQYRNTLNLLIKFEKFLGHKILIKDIDTELLYSFFGYMEQEKYSVGKISREIGRIRFFCNRIKEKGLRITEDYKKVLHIDKTEENFEKAYLTQAEIQKILNTDFSFDPELQIAKQHYTILLFTGMRANDVLSNLDVSNIDNDLIKLRTSKTGQTVVIPMHPEIKKVLKHNFGHFPPKITLLSLNASIRKMAQVCEIDQPTAGKVFCNKTKRKIAGVYKKYELLSSHSARRGFATLYKGIISDDAICSILGWTNSKMLKLYNQKSKEDYAAELGKVWSL